MENIKKALFDILDANIVCYISHDKSCYGKFEKSVIKINDI